MICVLQRKARKEEKAMAGQKLVLGLAMAGIIVIGIWVPGSVPQAAAETLNFRSFTHYTKMERVPVADVEGHFVGVFVREGVQILENGGMAWVKVTGVSDLIKGAGTLDLYGITTFQDGSTITTRMKGTLGTTPLPPPPAEITLGTGRFQGIKGTLTASTKTLPPEKGELGPKVITEGTLVYALPGK
jgi:hypothetical protein